MKSKKEVSAILQGGIGNYMFQVAAAYAYGKRYSKDTGFNCAESSGPHNHVTTYDDNIFKKVNLYYVSKTDRKNINEIDFNYSELSDFPNYNILLNGYFQSEKYFKDYEDEIRNLFMSYNVEIDNEVQELLDNYNTCSIHVRRGDFLGLPEHHPTQGMNYFLKAVKKMPKDSMFLIFSDDINWCKDNFPDLPEKFRFIEGNKDYEDLYIMSKCKNNIICNSTFSWWSAWLNDNSEKNVIAPIKWFGSAYSDWNTDDLYCEGWIKI